VQKLIILLYILISLLSASAYATKSLNLSAVSGDVKFKEEVYGNIVFIEDHLNKPIFDSQGKYNVFFKNEQIKKDEDHPESDTDIAYASIGEEECSIVFNKDLEWVDVSFKLVLLHELGHCLGLDHPEVDNGTIMDAVLDDPNDEIQDIPNFLLIVDGLVTNSPGFIKKEYINYYPLFLIQNYNYHLKMTYPFVY
jgi:hypothetical protein